MTAYGVQQWLRAAGELEATLEAELLTTRERRAKHDEELSDLASRRDTATIELAAAVLPELSPGAIARAVELTGYVTLRQEDPSLAYAQERQRLEARRAAIEAEPAFRDRVALRDPASGRLTLALEAQREHLEPLDRFLQRAAHPRMARLIQTGYGTDAYDVPWWRLSYYGDWEVGDELVERFPEKGWETFAPLREHYVQAKEAADALRARIRELQAEIDAGVALEREHARIQEDLAGALARRTLAEARARVRRFLVDCGPEALAGRIEADPQLEVLAKRWAGLDRQRVYLEHLGRHYLEPHEAALKRELAKVQRKRIKYRRPKHAYTKFTLTEFRSQFKDRRPRYTKLWKRYDRTYTALSRFDRYERGSLARDFLWWDLMTDGRLSGDFIPEVQRFRQQHPDYRYVPERDDEDALAAAAVASADLGPEADLFDAS